MLGLHTGCWLVLLACAAPLNAQAIDVRLPAAGKLKSGAGASGSAVVIVGVPGELSEIRFRPRPPFAADGWSLTLMQAGEVTQTWTGGPKQRLRTGEVEFGADGALGVIVRPLGANGGGFTLKASSRLPIGFKDPAIVESLVPGAEPPSHPDHALSSSTWLRPGLELRARLSFGPNGDGTNGLFVDVSPELQLTPPATAGQPSTLALDFPDWPFPHSFVDTYEPSSFVHATYEIEEAKFKSLDVRVKRHSVFIDPYDDTANLAPDVWHPSLDATEVPVGATLLFSATTKPVNCETTKTARLWLASPHALGWKAEAGTLLAEPVAIEVGPEPGALELSFTLPPEVGPGLYEVQLLVGTQGVSGPCTDSPLSPPSALLLRVMEP